MKLRYNQLNLRKYEAHAIILSIIEPHSKVLDLGCASGYIGKYLKIEKKCEIWGIEQDKNLAVKARKIMKRVFIKDLRNINNLNINTKFDAILLADVVEHITFYDQLLRSIKKYMKSGGKLIISTPNIANISIRWNLFLGKFNYSEKGILDKTHVHFFTKNSLLYTLRSHGYKIESIDYSADFGQIPIFGRILKFIPKNIQYKITTVFNTILSIQFIVVCRK